MRSRMACMVAAVLLSGCNGGGSDPGPVAKAVLAVFDGNAQSATVASAVATRPAVRVTTDGSPTANKTVTFAVTGGSGTITGATQTTDANGVARVGGWTLGTAAGSNSLSASVMDADGSPVTITATAVAGAASQIVKQSGDAQTAAAGSAVAVAPAVEVRDQYGNKVSGQQVTFAVTGGGGSATALTQTTDANGIARVGSWTLGAAVGANTLSATAGSATTTFTATAVAGAASQVFKQAGDAQTASAGAAVAVRPALRVADQFGNPVAGVQVTFTTTTGAITGGTQATGADGIATIGSWTLSQLAGANTLTATAAGAALANNPATFTATGTPGAAATMTKVGDNQSANVGAPVAIAPAVDVKDIFGNSIFGQQVIFAVTGGGGSVTGATTTTNASGRATLGSWTLGAAAGANTLSATAGTISVTFNATGNAVFNAAQYVGTYSGTWTNTTFASVGTATAVVTINQATNVATAAITVTGNVLNSGGVAPTSQNANYNASGGTFNGVHAVMGTVVATVNASGQVVASGTNIPNVTISRWDATGTLTAAQLQLNFTVTFVSGPPAVGTILLLKGV